MRIDLYDLFNNSTTAAILAVLVAAYFATSAYKNQKKVDREEEIKIQLIENLITLNEKINYVILILNRMVNSRKLIKSVNDISIFLEALEKHEIPKLSNVINEDIPFLDMKINNFFEIYGFDLKNTMQIIEYKKELKKWHTNILEKIPSEEFDFTNKPGEIDAFKIDVLKVKIKNLINYIGAGERSL